MESSSNSISNGWSGRHRRRPVDLQERLAPPSSPENAFAYVPRLRLSFLGRPLIPKIEPQLRRHTPT